MPVRYVPRYTRRDLKTERGTLFVFGDNLTRRGFGGQAGECRGEVNAIGIATKRYPGRAEADYFTDADFNRWRADVTPHFQRLADHVRSGGTVVWPADGIGTGLAELPARAPRIWAALERARLRLEALTPPDTDGRSPPQRSPSDPGDLPNA